MILKNAPSNWKRNLEKISQEIHGRSRWRLPVLFFGIIFAGGRRTVTSWLKAAGIGKGFQQFYFFLGSLGRRSIEKIADILFDMILRVALWNKKEILAAIDDTPTRRYGPKVQGAGVHHDHSSKPTNQTFLYGHIWVTLSLVIEHRWFGIIGLPLLSRLYVRKKDVPGLQKEHGWTFKTKLELSLELILWLHKKCERWGKKLTVVFDGGYSKAGVMKGVPDSITTIGRLRRDAALRTLPDPKRPGQRGRPPKYGKKKICLVKRAGQKRGWKKVTIRGKQREYKAFQATYRAAVGPILVVLVRYPNNTWAPCFCSNPKADPLQVLEIVADRWVIEENFKELKETLGAGQQQVRNVHANIACWHLCMWTYVMVYLWSWRMPQEVLVDRSDAPWDSPTRRPSFNDRLCYLRQCFWESAISDANFRAPKRQKLFRVLRALKLRLT